MVSYPHQSTYLFLSSKRASVCSLVQHKKPDGRNKSGVSNVYVLKVSRAYCSLNAHRQPAKTMKLSNFMLSSAYPRYSALKHEYHKHSQIIKICQEIDVCKKRRGACRSIIMTVSLCSLSSFKVPLCSIHSKNKDVRAFNDNSNANPCYKG
ncbi:hypothetical protein BDF20DRAFT_99563 [Mycotypha africana]|uniref:uncharacterized protein n=1 Tax=Mycotypha africana TaxID=64632 RepID=UPI0023019084|nr:uncharacterized protein BDF20DRAFT_99563 [Mycotypha africana]KAI8970026.1 hypothetical protein BDF20DRAFT_99563 [Mycotypha africana]